MGKVAIRQEVLCVPALVERKVVDDSSSTSPSPQRRRPTHCRQPPEVRSSKDHVDYDADDAADDEDADLSPLERYMLRTGEIAESYKIQSSSLRSGKRTR